jgi:hypothetical protein
MIAKRQRWGQWHQLFPFINSLATPGEKSRLSEATLYLMISLIDSLGLERTKYHTLCKINLIINPKKYIVLAGNVVPCAKSAIPNMPRRDGSLKFFSAHHPLCRDSPPLSSPMASFETPSSGARMLWLTFRDPDQPYQQMGSWQETLLLH